MPFTVITLSNVPRSLRGDLTKWMQEIATGVYIGNFNSKIREKIWERVVQNLGDGEATLSYSYRNEIGYNFSTYNTKRENIDYEGIPLVLLPVDHSQTDVKRFERGFSHASKLHKVRKFSSVKSNQQEICRPYVVIDIETDGLEPLENQIIEIGCVKSEQGHEELFHSLIEYQGILPEKIKNLTGINENLLTAKGRELPVVLEELLEFLGDHDLVGYNLNFDLLFINNKLKKHGLKQLANRSYDLLRYVKKEKMFLDNYKLDTVLLAYGINKEVPHRALLDAQLIFELSCKVNGFMKTRKHKA